VQVRGSLRLQAQLSRARAALLQRHWQMKQRVRGQQRLLLLLGVGVWRLLLGACWLAGPLVQMRWGCRAVCCRA
jgi:hypothetical protein